MSQDIPTFGVKSLSMSIKRMLESSYSKIYIKGQVSQPKRMNHLYFSLKEEDAVLDCVCWANVKLSFEPQHDMEIICCGRISSYPGRSKYQIIILSVEHIGDSQVLEKRKLALQKEGLFDISKKPQLPKYPKNVGIITSPTGAVLHDMLHRLRDRYPCEVLFHPALVQGTEMSKSVINAINYFNTKMVGKIDLLIVARGGGSFEDLWGFQDEDLVRAIASTTIPIITAIGHETDTTLSDYAASCRAPTPTAAIEIAFPDRNALYARFNSYASKITSIVRFYMDNSCKQKLLTFKVKSPKEVIIPISQNLKSKIIQKDHAYSQYWNQRANIINSIEKIKYNLKPLQRDLIYKVNLVHERYKNYVLLKDNAIKKLYDKIKSISYEGTLKRGFCRAHIDGKLIKYKNDAPDQFFVEFQDGSLEVEKVK